MSASTRVHAALEQWILRAEATASDSEDETIPGLPWTSNWAGASSHLLDDSGSITSTQVDTEVFQPRRFISAPNCFASSLGRQVGERDQWWVWGTHASVGNWLGWGTENRIFRPWRRAWIPTWFLYYSSKPEDFSTSHQEVENRNKEYGSSGHDGSALKNQWGAYSASWATVISWHSTLRASALLDCGQQGWSWSCRPSFHVPYPWHLRDRSKEIREVHMCPHHGRWIGSGSPIRAFLWQGQASSCYWTFVPGWPVAASSCRNPRDHRWQWEQHGAPDAFSKEELGPQL